MRAIITALMAMLVMQVDAFSVEPRVLAAASILMEWRPKICVGASTSTSTACHHLLRHRQPRILTARSMSSIPDESEPSSMKRRKKVKGRVVGGDRLRESTGIRPSIHPTVINCISEALLLRSRNILGRNGNDSRVAIDIGDSNTKPLDIAITAGDIASSAIQKRNDAEKTGYEGFTYDDDDDDDDDEYSNDKEDINDENDNRKLVTNNSSPDEDAFNIQESQLICGRVVGVVMRLRDLETTLLQRVMAASWVRKYREESSFGVLREECDDDDDGTATRQKQEEKKTSLDQLLAEKIVNDPLIRMNRAECLLALFLNNVERPTMEKLSASGEEVATTAGTSTVDFIDIDRLEVLMNEL